MLQDLVGLITSELQNQVVNMSKYAISYALKHRQVCGKGLLSKVDLRKLDDIKECVRQTV